MMRFLHRWIACLAAAILLIVVAQRRGAVGASRCSSLAAAASPLTVAELAAGSRPPDPSADADHALPDRPDHAVSFGTKGLPQTADRSGDGRGAGPGDPLADLWPG